MRRPPGQCHPQWKATGGCLEVRDLDDVDLLLPDDGQVLEHASRNVGSPALGVLTSVGGPVQVERFCGTDQFVGRLFHSGDEGRWGSANDMILAG